LKSLIVGFALALIPVPAGAVEVNATVGGIIAGEVMCSLKRHGASDDVLSLELGRITQKLKSAKLLDLSTDAGVYYSTSAAVLKECPSATRHRDGLH
jgi:hypothetical protein